MKYKDFDNRDTVLQVSLWCVGKFLHNDLSYAIELDRMATECRIHTLFHQRKNPSYKWSNSDGMTKFIYKHFLRFININPYKGLNFDQLRSYWILLYLHKNRRFALKHLLGFVLRLGFTPAFQEHILFKPQAMIMLLATIWRPLHWLVHIPFSILGYYEIEHGKGTSNKISLLPTMYLLDYEMPESKKIGKWYQRYFKPKTPQSGIGVRLWLCLSNVDENNRRIKRGK